MVCGYGEGRLRDPGPPAGQGADRQGLALHRLVAPAADPSSWLCAGRRRPSAGDRPEPAAESTRPGAGGSPRRWPTSPIRRPTSSRPRRLAADQGPLARSPLPGDLKAWRLGASAKRSAATCRATASCATTSCSSLPPAGRARPRDIARLRRISLDRASAVAVIAAVRAALDLPEKELPVIEPPAKLPRGIGPLVDLLARAAEIPVRGAPRRPAAGRNHRRPGGDRRLRRAGTGVPALRGWRFEVFGRAALTLKQGKVGLGTVAKGQVAVVPMRGASPRRPDAPVGPGPRPGRSWRWGTASFLAQASSGGAGPGGQVEAVAHDAIDRPDLLDGVGCVVNFARHPMGGCERRLPAFEAMDPDLRLARRLGKRDITY